ncbi:hypothetical protein Bp8pS_175 [Bacillus phage vB_BpuM-BpSp]|nr:hypothetical protein Bp8pS_175 [Bacillus phage vB_BpuM-BpSp]
MGRKTELIKKVLNKISTSRIKYSNENVNFKFNEKGLNLNYNRKDNTNGKSSDQRRISGKDKRKSK